MKNIELKQINNDKNGVFEIIYDGQKAGLMTYVWTGADKFIIDHTEVNEAFEGKGLGKELVKAAVEFARENNVKIIPLCPFAKKVMEQNPDFTDVLS